MAVGECHIGSFLSLRVIVIDDFTVAQFHFIYIMKRCIYQLLYALAAPIVIAYDTKLVSVPAATRSELARTLTRTNDTQFINIPFPNIVGGEPAEDDEFPWFGRTDITFFTDSDSVGFSCGSSLIHSDIAVSAAHCVVDAIREYIGYSYTITFNLGATSYSGSDGIELQVENIYYPKDYDFPENDIVFYKLRTATDVTPVLWNTNPLIPLRGDIGTAIGFGLTSDNGDESSILLKVDLPAITNLECSQYFNVPDSITCSYAEGEGKDICQGDSGGPIVTQDGVLYGITSFSGKICATRPSGFTRTSYFSDFMTKVSDFVSFCRYKYVSIFMNSLTRSLHYTNTDHMRLLSKSTSRLRWF